MSTRASFSPLCHVFAASALALALNACPPGPEPPVDPWPIGPAAPRGELLFFGGPIVTMDAVGTVAEAIFVRDGRIEAVGTLDEVMGHKTDATELVDLAGATLMPGFIDPHMHIADLILMSLITDLTPCLPDRYRTNADDCPLTIIDALEFLRDHREPRGAVWFTANGIDPSRMSLDGSGAPPTPFHDDPIRYIEEHVSKTEPVFILDDSGHLAYVNRQAFVAAGVCDAEDFENCGPATAKKKPALPGRWATADGKFTGLLEETAGFTPIVAGMTKGEPIKVWLEEVVELVEHSEEIVKEIGRAGVTTIVNGGALSTTEAEFVKLLAQRHHPLLRYRTIVQWSVAEGNPDQFPRPVIWNDEDHGLYGASGIKLWADGSTQGCTASLIDPYDESGICAAAGTGAADYSQSQIIENLEALWNAGWYIQIHANGDQAITDSLGALIELQKKAKSAGSPNENPITLLHFTVDGNPAKNEDMVQHVANLRRGIGLDGQPVEPVDVHVSHLIGHVAYWGGSFQSMLDGVTDPGQSDPTGRAARLDAARRVFELEVPFSLHSDSPVTPVHPLWYVEQAVTRNTWFYPKLGDVDVQTMPGEQNITIEQALRAITIEPARQHRLDSHLGSIEVDKVADLVILDRNPLDSDPDEIHEIQVLSTFVNGFRNDWK